MEFDGGEHFSSHIAKLGTGIIVLTWVTQSKSGEYDSESHKTNVSSANVTVPQQHLTKQWKHLIGLIDGGKKEKKQA